MSERKLVKFRTLGLGEEFWWAGVKWKRRQDGTGVRVRKVIGKPHDRAFLDDDYVKVKSGHIL